MIEILMLEHLERELNVPVYPEIPENPPERYVIIRKADSHREDFLCCSMMLARSYGPTLLAAAELNEAVVKAMKTITNDHRVSGCYCTGDYNFTDTVTKRYRYQAVFDIYHF